MWRLLLNLAGDDRTLYVFLLITVIIGGGAAWLTGRAIASTWRPWWHVVFYALVLGSVARFLQFALFEEPLLSPRGYLADASTCLLIGLMGFRVTRVTQMITRYGWINKRAGPMQWQRRPMRTTGDGSESR
jgi:hypothetical protein